MNLEKRCKLIFKRYKFSLFTIFTKILYCYARALFGVPNSANSKQSVVALDLSPQGFKKLNELKELLQLQSGNVVRFCTPTMHADSIITEFCGNSE